jgi:hypothetical protein
MGEVPLGAPMRGKGTAAKYMIREELLSGLVRCPGVRFPSTVPQTASALPRAEAVSFWQSEPWEVWRTPIVDSGMTSPGHRCQNDPGTRLTSYLWNPSVVWIGNDIEQFLDTATPDRSDDPWMP